MSKYIKMSDAFAMDTKIENATGEGFLLKDNNCEYEEESLAVIFDLNQAIAITHAINKHDRLIEENIKLNIKLTLATNMLDKVYCQHKLSDEEYSNVYDTISPEE